MLRTFLLPLFTSILVVSCGSLPVPSGYVGIGGGGSRLDIDSGTTDNSFDQDTSSTGKILAGIDLDSRLGVELFYADFGEGVLNSGQSVGYTATGIDSVLYLIPGRVIPDRGGRLGFSLFGRFGVASIDNQSDARISQDNTLNLSTGVGAEYGFNSGLGLRASVGTLDADVQSLQLSLLYRFPVGERAKNRTIVTAPVSDDGNTPVASSQNETPTVNTSSSKPDADEEEALLLTPLPTSQSTDSQFEVTQSAERPEPAVVSRPATPSPAPVKPKPAKPAVVASNTTALVQAEPSPPADIEVEIMSGSSVEEGEGERTATGTSDRKETDSDRCTGSSERLNTDKNGCSSIAGYLDTVQFESGSAVLTLDAKTTLNEVTDYLMDNPDLRFSVQTVPAANADADFSRFLAKRRTLAVIRYLIARDIAGSRLKAAISGASAAPVEKRDNSRSWVVFRPL